MESKGPWVFLIVAQFVPVRSQVRSTFSGVEVEESLSESLTSLIDSRPRNRSIRQRDQSFYPERLFDV